MLISVCARTLRLLSSSSSKICPSDEHSAVHGHQAIIFGYHVNGGRHGTSLRCQICLGFITAAKQGTNKQQAVSEALHFKYLLTVRHGARRRGGLALGAQGASSLQSVDFDSLLLVSFPHIFIIILLSGVIEFHRAKRKNSILSPP